MLSPFGTPPMHPQSLTPNRLTRAGTIHWYPSTHPPTHLSVPARSSATQTHPAGTRPLPTGKKIQNSHNEMSALKEPRPCRREVPRPPCRAEKPRRGGRGHLKTGADYDGPIYSDLAALSKTSNPQGKVPSLLLQPASPRRAAQDASPGRGLPEEDSWGMVGEWLAERAAVGMNIILYRCVGRR